MPEFIELRHSVKANETFEEAAQAIVALVYKAEIESPGASRHLHLDIEGHKNSSGGWDHDMFELQKEFLIGFLMPHLTELTMPLGRVRNPKPQDNDVPEEFQIIPRESKALVQEIASMEKPDDGMSFKIVDGDELRGRTAD